MAFNLKLKNEGSTNKCVRFPIKLVKEIEKVINEYNVTFSHFVIEACKYALENMEKKPKKEKVKN